MHQSACRASVVLVLLAAAAWTQPAAAQVSPKTLPVSSQLVDRVAATVSQELVGVVTDGAGQPLKGAVVSALGVASAYALSDRDGRFVLRNLPSGPYVVRAHLHGYVSARGRVVQVSSARGGLSITLQKRAASADDPPQVLAAGIGPVDPQPEGEVEDPDDHDHAEVAWRLRHSRRSVLKEASNRVGLEGLEVLQPESVLAGLGWAVEGSARLASALMPDVDLKGQFNLLTSTSIDRPQDLFSADGQMPRGVAFLSLVAPGDSGEWRMRGTVTQGDLSSWIVSGSFVRKSEAAHAYEAGVSYAMQRYLGGNADALVALRDGSRNVGTLYAYDTWTVSPRLQLNYGARYADYDYLDDERLFSPRAGIVLQPIATDPAFRVRAAASRSETAPGAVEFLPPVAGVWLPPERTFSSIGEGGFVAQRVDHLEAGLEQDIGTVIVSARAFRERTTNQVIGVFGSQPAPASSRTGHYYVGSGGDFDASGWGVSAESGVGGHTRAVVDYQHASAAWGRSLSRASVALAVPDGVYRHVDRVSSLSASIESMVAPTDTKLLVIYRLSKARSLADEGSAAGGSRFEVQVNQPLPFLAFSNAKWEALVALRNMFYGAGGATSVYDEILIVRPPMRVLGGVTVKF